MLIYGTLVFFTWLMVLITLQYVPAKTDVAFLRVKEDQVQLWYYRVAFFTHVYTAVFVLMAGILQFSLWIRSKYTILHRIIGKFYVATILMLSGPSGLIMGYYANGGILAKIAFCTLACLWIFFTYKAYDAARNKDFVRHRAFMYRSFALTLSAVSLRLFKYIIVNLFHTPPMDTYILVSWLGWTVNLAIAEMLIHREQSVNTRRKNFVV